MNRELIALAVAAAVVDGGRAPSQLCLVCVSRSDMEHAHITGHDVTGLTVEEMKEANRLIGELRDPGHAAKVDKLLRFLHEWFLEGQSAIHPGTLVDDVQTFDELVAQCTVGRIPQRK